MASFFTENLNIIAQIMGFIAMGLNIICFQFSKHRTIMAAMTLSSVFWIAHYLMLGLYPAAAINIMNMFRNYIYSLRESKNLHSKLIPAAFMVIAAVSVLLTWENAWSVLPLLASVTATAANWQTATKKLRLLSFPRYFLWLVYDLVNGAWAGAANDVFTMGSIGISLWREERQNCK